jgi:HlyD family secretion protein
MFGYKNSRRMFGLILASICTILLSACNNHKSIQGYIEGKYTYLSSAVSGTLEQLLVQRGDQIKPSQKIFVLDQEPEASNLIAAQQKLSQAENTFQDLKTGGRATIIAAIEAQKEQALASLELSKKTLDRYQNLQKLGAIDKASLDQALATYKNDSQRVTQTNANLAEAKLGAREKVIEAQQAVVDEVKAEIKKAQWALEQKTKNATQNSLVFDTFFNVGEMVASGQPVVSLLTKDNVKIIFFVAEKDLSKIKLGQKINFTCDGCQKNYPAKISFISNQAEYTPPVIYSQEGNEKLVYRVEAPLDPALFNVFHPGQPVNIMIND